MEKRDGKSPFGTVPGEGVHMEDFAGERLLFRKYRRSDAASFTAFFADAQRMKFYLPEPFRLFLSLEELQEELDSWQSEQSHLFCMVEKKTGSPLGLLSVEQFDPRRAAGEHALIGVALLREAEGQGFAEEALRTLLKTLFDKYKVHMVYAQIAEENRSSLKLAKKVGFVQNGRQSDFFLRDGHYYDLLCFEMKNPAEG